MTHDEELLWLARKLKNVRETLPNRGQRVEAIQKWCGGEAGQSWCAYFVTMLLDIVYEGKAPLPRTGSCDVLLEDAKKNDWLTETPAIGDLYLVLRSPTDAHHVGIVTELLSLTQFMGISGNTNDTGSDNGDGVYEKPITYAEGKIVFVHYDREETT